MKENSKKASDDDSRKWADLNVEYQLLHSDIQFAKNQQWRITNYGVAVYVALIAVFQIVKGSITVSVSICEKVAFSLVGLLAMIFGIWLLSKETKSLDTARNRLRIIRKQLHSEVQDPLGFEDPTGRRICSVLLSTVLMGVLILGWVFVSYIIFRV